MSILSKILIVIPTYNECDNIAPIIKAIFDLNMGLHLLIVDDNSPDHTAHFVKKLQPHYSGQLYLLNCSEKQGLGRAYLMGFSWALLHGYEYICSMDADFSHLPSDLPRLLKICMQNEGDISIGSRYIVGSHIVYWPRTRILLSHVANWVVKSFIGIPVQDATAGFVCYKRTILKSVLLNNITSTGYSFQVEIKLLAYQCGAKLVEIPITFTDRVKGVSKMNIKIVVESFLQLFRIKWRSLFHRRNVE
ncbi:polyprenol monophosphomannose synthase [Cardinium endosymbiont of Culicoides punctatus]|uniref:polyprenol monophosphomannose synthase n=1 Tax=Cardinium endosymbiont of Culicoides punctatus TaxID=2304601 RepID=UPI001058EEFE|nr:polyprenol monophosphomannose synthase [Cardinium endosymbiont of Culicoides punctatus]TDG95001.1 Polyprenol monophosphomannose synthase [Cardinium endosymbiont of Culicoides punctatus]